MDRVHGTVPGVSLPTVYAALELLTDLGLALRVHAGRAVRFDPRSQPHHHLVCTACGAVADLDADVELGPALERARALGAQTSGAEVVVRGLCSDCARLEQRREPAPGARGGDRVALRLVQRERAAR